jgi:transcriptional regulator with GAF, ATPase, and Fis domain
MLKDLLVASAWGEISTEWAAEDAPGEGRDRVLSALALLGQPESDPASRAQKILVMALEATGAERVFFFETAPTTPGEPPTLGQCLGSLNIDREQVLEPISKVPVTLLKEVLNGGKALFVSDVDADPRWQGEQASHEMRTRAFGAVPLLAGGSAVGLLYFDHRFRPVELERAAARELFALCQALGALRHAERLLNENQSLWKDIVRLQESVREGIDPLVTTRTRGNVNRSRYRGDYSFIVGSSPPMHEIFQLLDRVSSSTAPVLINGESGTGKELIAQAVHRNSPRNGKPFVSENCGALTETLLESELFGYVKGAFTGAGKDHKGLFELADSGSLFLDEVGDMSPGMQKKLLRVLQEGMIRRVGGKDIIRVDVRLICATNKDLMEECKQGRFREDLYYRLNVINIKVPGLRERREDIPELVEHFLADLATQSGRKKEIEPAALKRLCLYAWPGNVRELQNEVKRMYALSDEGITVGDLSEVILSGDGRDLLHGGLERELMDLTLREATDKLEKELIRRALFSARGNKSLVAKKLQIPKTSLYNKINKYQLDQEMP